MRDLTCPCRIGFGCLNRPPFPFIRGNTGENHVILMVKKLIEVRKLTKRYGDLKALVIGYN